METNKKIRSPRCTAEQYAQMVNFIDQNKVLVQGKTSLEETKECEVKWKELSVMLKGLKGAKKTPAQWKRTFVEYKSKVKRHARNLLIEQRETGGGIKNIKDLSETEEKLMSIIGWVSTSGDPQLEEPGIRATEKNEENGSKESENIILLDEIIVANVVTNDDVGIDQIFEVGTPEKQIPVKETPVLRKTARKIIQKTKRQSIKMDQLRTVANIFEKNSNQLCKCLENLANSIYALANANQSIATAIFHAEKCKEQRAD